MNRICKFKPSCFQMFLEGKFQSESRSITVQGDGQPGQTCPLFWMGWWVDTKSSSDQCALSHAFFVGADLSHAIYYFWFLPPRAKGLYHIIHYVTLSGIRPRFCLGPRVWLAVLMHLPIDLVHQEEKYSARPTRVNNNPIKISPKRKLCFN